jgi:hypothetical protein
VRSVKSSSQSMPRLPDSASSSACHSSR